MSKLIITFIFILFFSSSQSYARAGGGRSFGSRGSRMTAPRSYSNSNPNPYSAPRGQTPGTTPYNPSQQPMQSSGFGGGGFLRSMAGGLAGGMLGSMLFRNQGGSGIGGSEGTGGGGIGLIEILLLAGGAFFIFRWVKQRNGASFATASPNGFTPTYRDSVPLNMAPVQDERDIAGILSQNDPSFEPTEFKEARTDDFFKLQAALMNREISSIRDKMTSEIFLVFQSDITSLKESGKINRIENIAVREAEITEAWEESGQTYATLRLKASLLDYTVDDKTGAVISGSATEPIKFQEHWTFVRDLTNRQWKLSAIENNL